MIKFNGIEIRTPSDYQISNMDLVEGSERNANGEAFAERIATKVKIELTWSYINKDKMAQIINILETSFFFNVEFIDLDGIVKTYKFYPGDRGAGMQDYRSRVPRWKEFKFNIIQK